MKGKRKNRKKSFYLDLIIKILRTIIGFVLVSIIGYIIMPEKIDAFLYGTLASTKPVIIEFRGEAQEVYLRKKLALIADDITFANNHCVRTTCESCPEQAFHSSINMAFADGISSVRFSLTNNTSHTIQIESVHLNVIGKVKNPKMYPFSLKDVDLQLEYLCNLNSQIERTKCDQIHEGTYKIDSRDIEEFNLSVTSTDPFKYLVNIEVIYYLQGGKYSMKVPDSILLSYYEAAV